MCGILGSINIENTRDFLHHISHRGPDSHGEETYNVGGHRVDLLHHRLSIVDLSVAGHQPMPSQDGLGFLTYNGEIYNHLNLKKELKEIPFKGHSDTETILNYFRKNPIDGSLKQLNGIFAIGYLNAENKKFYLARDRFGIKPLYYYFEGNTLLFSSELRPIKAWLNPEVDASVAVNSQRMRFTPSPLTLYKKIFKVEPGQLLTFNLDKDQIACSKSYYIEKRSLGSKKGDFKKLVTQYGILFEKAVKRQLMADVDLGILLSGGVDSALVAAIAQQNSEKKIKAFTIGFDGEHAELDEIDHAKETAEVLGLEHYVKKIGFHDFLASMEKTVGIVEEPIGTTSIIPMYFLSELAASHVKVVLSGQGADEPLGGYDKYKALAYLEKARYLKDFSPVLSALSPIYKRKEHLRRFINAIAPKNPVDSWMEFNAISSFDEINTLLNPESGQNIMVGLRKHQDHIRDIWKRRTPENSNLKDIFLYYDTRSSLADDLLMYTDKITMNFGLECRVPILDNDLIEFIESLDSSYKFNSKEGKIIHKAFAKEYLPASIVERKKLGFKSPTEAWFKEKTHELETVFSKNQEFMMLFNIEKVKAILKRHNNGENLEKQIFLLLSLNYLLNAK